MTVNNNWTEEQITVVLYEYCRRPFGQFNGTKPFVIELGNLLNRTPGAVVRKVGNLASYDPQMRQRGVGGLGHTSKLDGIVWKKYYGHWDDLALDAEVIISKLKEKTLEQSLDIDLTNLPIGSERITEVKQRINQDFFRRTVISSYNQQCCITGINNPQLLEACHILDWSCNKEHRTNPHNGLCMNVLFHKAYDANLLGITADYKIVISEQFFGSHLFDVDETTRNSILKFNNQMIKLPRRFLPDRDFLAERYENYLKLN